MHSYHNKLLPNHFDEYFIPLSSIHYHSTRLAISENLFFPGVNSSSRKCSLKFIGPKVWSAIPDDVKFWTTSTFQWKLKKHLLHEKNSQLWTLVPFRLSEQNPVYSNILFIFCVYLLSHIFFLGAHFMLFGMKVHYLVLSVLLSFSFASH